MSEYFPKPNFLGPNVNVELDLSNYAIKTDFKKCNIKMSKFGKQKWYCWFPKKTGFDNNIKDATSNKMN